MRERNRSEYNKKPVQRGSLEFLIDLKILKQPKVVGYKRKPGRPPLFSGPLILILLMVKIQFRLPYRALEEVSKFIFNILQKSIDLPTYTTICKRAGKIKDTLPT